MRIIDARCRRGDVTNHCFFPPEGGGLRSSVIPTWYEIDGSHGGPSRKETIEHFFEDIMFERNVMNAQMLEVSLFVAIGTMLRLERHAWSTVETLRQEANEANEYAPFRRPTPPRAMVP